MQYDYSLQKPKLLTLSGADTLLTVRDNALRLLETQDTFTGNEAIHGCTGELCMHLAALDYLVERGLIHRTTAPADATGMHQTFVAGLTRNLTPGPYGDLAKARSRASKIADLDKESDMKTNKFSNLFAALAVGASVLMTGCSPEINIAELAPGAYINKTTDTTAQIIIVASDKSRTTLNGGIEIEASFFHTLSRIVPVITATYKVKTTECGAIEFIESQVGVICHTCMKMQATPAYYASCPRGAFEMYQTWTTLGI